MRGLRNATSFLTRLRVRGDGELSRGVPWFPVVGALLGIVLAGIYALARAGLPSFPAAVLTIAFAVWATGAFHEDGLADMADAFGTPRSREDTLRILKDPRLGTYGVSALVLALALRVAALSALDARTAFAVLPAAHALSRAGAVLMLRGPMATEDGLGSSYASTTNRTQVVGALVVGFGVGVLALGPLVVPAATGVLLASFVLGRLARRRIGGVTGDVMGAAQQVGEIVVLIFGAAAPSNLPWWG